MYSRHKARLGSDKSSSKKGKKVTVTTAPVTLKWGRIGWKITFWLVRENTDVTWGTRDKTDDFLLGIYFTLLKWNGIKLTFPDIKRKLDQNRDLLSMQEALELLRCTPRETELEVCRIPKEIAEKMGIHSNAETPTNAASYSCYSSSQTNSKWLTPVLTLSILGVILL